MQIGTKLSIHILLALASFIKFKEEEKKKRFKMGAEKVEYNVE